jgi:hypothetical protein
MTESGRSDENDAARGRQQRRRMKHGIIASYIHQLSQRHNASDHRDEPVAPREAEEALT